MGKPIWGKWANNYDVVQLQVQTSPQNFKWENPLSGFRDMRSAKSGPNRTQYVAIWQVFGPWACPYGANEQMTLAVHNYRPREFHRTSIGEKQSSGYRDMGSASLAAAHPVSPSPGPWRQYPSSPESWGVKRNWRSRSIKPQTALDLNYDKMHFLFKLGNSNLNRWWAIPWTKSKWGKFRLCKLNLTLNFEGQSQSTPETLGI